MREIKFDNAEDMLYTITGGTDLYCEDTETYVFLYNNEGSICVYRGIDKDEADKLEELAVADEEYWGAYLGAGGDIIDSDRYYAEQGRERPKWAESPIEWCERSYRENWVVCGYDKFSGVLK